MGLYIYNTYIYNTCRVGLLQLCSCFCLSSTFDCGHWCYNTLETILILSIWFVHAIQPICLMLMLLFSFPIKSNQTTSPHHTLTTHTHTFYQWRKSYFNRMLYAHFITFSLSFILYVLCYLFRWMVVCTLVKCIAIDEIALVIDNCSRILWVYLFFLCICVSLALCYILSYLKDRRAQHTIKRTLDCVTLFIAHNILCTHPIVRLL